MNSFNLHLVLTFIFLKILGVEHFNFYIVGHLNTPFLEYLIYIGLYSYWDVIFFLFICKHLYVLNMKSSLVKPHANIKSHSVASFNFVVFY